MSASERDAEKFQALMSLRSGGVLDILWSRWMEFGLTENEMKARAVDFFTDLHRIVEILEFMNSKEYGATAHGAD